MRIVEPTENNIRHAVKVLIDGGLVGMPTETVYGLACNALDPQSVHQVFVAKSRPANNPLIVHIAECSQLQTVASSWPSFIEPLIKRHWPGPLTLVLPKAKEIPYEVTAGRETVAVRIPKHPVARMLIKKAGFPLAAPSANRFMKLSATRPEHIDQELAPYVPIILNGGPCEVGIESTVLDCTENSFKILRPGVITSGQIQAALGRPLAEFSAEAFRKSPGMYPRHYAPKAKVILSDKIHSDQPGLTFHPPQNNEQVKMPTNPSAYAARLYHAMHQLDNMGVDYFVIEAPPKDPEWEAILDRLRKASYTEAKSLEINLD